MIEAAAIVELHVTCPAMALAVVKDVRSRVRDVADGNPGIVASLPAWARPKPVDVWVITAGGVVYATRPTRAEIDTVVAEQRHLIEHFGPPVIERRVVAMRWPS